MCKTHDTDALHAGTAQGFELLRANEERFGLLPTTDLGEEGLCAHRDRSLELFDSPAARPQQLPLLGQCVRKLERFDRVEASGS